MPGFSEVSDCSANNFSRSPEPFHARICHQSCIWSETNISCLLLTVQISLVLYVTTAPPTEYRQRPTSIRSSILWLARTSGELCTDLRGIDAGSRNSWHYLSTGKRFLTHQFIFYPWQYELSQQKSVCIICTQVPTTVKKKKKGEENLSSYSYFFSFTFFDPKNKKQYFPSFLHH